MPKIQVNETTVVHVSEGNSKLGKVPNLSMTPGESCGYPVCYSDGCYALRPYRMYLLCGRHGMKILRHTGGTLSVSLRVLPCGWDNKPTE